MYNDKTIEKLKQKILDLAIRGKLVPQDPNDEPASVLIEKIRKEKEKLIKEGKIKKPKEDSFIFKGSDNLYYENVNEKVKCIQDEIPFEIPESWMWVRLGNIFEIGSSKRVHKSDWKNAGIPFYRARDIELLNKGIFKSELYIGQNFYDDIKNKYGVPKINDLLITAVGTIGKTLVVESNNPFYYKDGNIICLHNLYSINPYWIKIIFDSNYIYNALHTSSKGTTVDTYTIIHSNKTLIPLAPCNNQINIINKYNEIISTINVLNDEICNIKTIKEKTKLRILDIIFNKSSSYKSYYENRISTNLEEYIDKSDIGDGDWVLSENMDESGTIKLVQLKHIGSGKYIDKPYCKINNSFFAQNKCSEIKEDYLLINRLVSDKMNVCIMPNIQSKCLTSVDVCWIKPNNKYLTKYLMYYLMSPYFQKEVMNLCSGSTRKRISKKNLIKIPISIHSFKDQKEIVKRIDNIFTLIDNM